MKVIVYGEEFPCVRAVKGADYVELYDAGGTCFASFAGISDFSGYRVEDGAWSDPEPEEMDVVASIAFVALAEIGGIDDVTAGEHVDLFAPWEPGVKYEVGNLRKYNARLYRCIQSHVSQADWTPDVAVSEWVKAADPTEEWPEWSQPVGAADAYSEGDKVSHNGKRWISKVSANVWEPGVYGWTEA